MRVTASAAVAGSGSRAESGPGAGVAQDTTPPGGVDGRGFGEVAGVPGARDSPLLAASGGAASIGFGGAKASCRRGESLPALGTTSGGASLPNRAKGSLSLSDGIGAWAGSPSGEPANGSWPEPAASSPKSASSELGRSAPVIPPIPRGSAPARLLSGSAGGLAVGAKGSMPWAAGVSGVSGVAGFAGGTNTANGSSSYGVDWGDDDFAVVGGGVIAAWAGGGANSPSGSLAGLGAALPAGLAPVTISTRNTQSAIPISSPSCRLALTPLPSGRPFSEVGLPP